MCKVKCIDNQVTYTVYGVVRTLANSSNPWRTEFLIYDKKLSSWIWKNAKDFEPADRRVKK